MRQFLALTRLNLAGIRARIAPALTIVIGVTCAVGTLVSMLAMGTGAMRQELGNVRADRVVIMGAGPQRDLSIERVAAIRDLAGIRKGPDGEAVLTLESSVPLEARRRLTGARVYFPLTGVSANVRTLEPELHLTEGQMFRPGLHELVVSNACVREFAGYGVGTRHPIHGSEWLIVGRFDLGSAQQCVAYADVDTLNAAFGRNSYEDVVLMLRSTADFDGLRAAALANPTLHVEVWHEREAVQRWFKQLNSLLSFVSYFVGSIMAVGATLGAVNSLYAMVDSRRRELATLRAIGFAPAAVVLSFLCEAVVLAVPGALLGCLLAWVFFNGLSASPFGFSFDLAVTPALAMIGAAWGLAMGLVGGILPAVRAARIPVTDALRAT